MPKVKGTRTATAIVAVSPGSAPMTVPAMTPATASTRLSGVSASSRNSMPGIVQILVWCRARPRQRTCADGKRRGAEWRPRGDPDTYFFMMPMSRAISSYSFCFSAMNAGMSASPTSTMAKPLSSIALMKAGSG